MRYLLNAGALFGGFMIHYILREYMSKDWVRLDYSLERGYKNVIITEKGQKEMKLKDGLEMMRLFDELGINEFGYE
jgi:hypothetical protein